MINNILGYVVTADVYYQLWMVAQTMNPTTAEPFRASLRHNSKNWHPVLIEQFNDVRDVPSTVEIENGEHQLDGEARFHTGNNKPTLSVDKMVLTWGKDFPERAEGPCKITLSGVKMWHHQGELHRRRGDAIIVEQAKFQWNTSGKADKLHREGGPYQIILSHITAKANVSEVNGEMVSSLSNMSFRKISVSWANSNGSPIGEARARDILNKHRIKVNYMLAGESVFADEGEEFIFWSELGGQL